MGLVALAAFLVDAFVEGGGADFALEKPDSIFINDYVQIRAELCGAGLMGAVVRHGYDGNVWVALASVMRLKRMF